VGIPAFNEENNIASIITKLSGIADTILVCNDGSTDLTSSLAKKSGAFVINHSKNLGYGASIKSIFVKAKNFIPVALQSIRNVLRGRAALVDPETAINRIKICESCDQLTGRTRDKYVCKI